MQTEKHLEKKKAASQEESLQNWKEYFTYRFGNAPEVTDKPTENMKRQQGQFPEEKS